MRSKLSESDLRHLLPYALLTMAIVALIAIPVFFSQIYLIFYITVLYLMLIIVAVRFYLSLAVSIRRLPHYFLRDSNWPYVSLVIPAYNEEQVLKRTIASMLALDYPKNMLEIIYVYESKSTDRTEEIILDYARSYSRIIPVKRESSQGGKAAALNFGLNFVQGEVIGIFDADHSIEPAALKLAVMALDSPKVACVKGRCRTINKSESILARVAGMERDLIERLDIYSRYVMGGLSVFGGGQFFLKRSTLESLGPFDEEIMTEDIDYSLRIHEAGLEIRVDPRIVTWEETPASFSNWFSQRKRWARGWMQCTRVHTLQIIFNTKMSFVKKIDAISTLIMSVLMVVMILTYPLVIFVYFGLTLSSLIPYWLIFWIGLLLTISPLLAGLIVWHYDIKNGENMHWKDLHALVLIWPYQFLQLFVAWTALEDEFMLKRKSEYVKTLRTGAIS